MMSKLMVLTKNDVKVNGFHENDVKVNCFHKNDVKVNGFQEKWCEK